MAGAMTVVKMSVEGNGTRLNFSGYRSEVPEETGANLGHVGNWGEKGRQANFSVVLGAGRQQHHHARAAHRVADVVQVFMTRMLEHVVHHGGQVMKS